MNQNTSDEINLINTTYEIFTGATVSTDGTSGLVPMPIKGDDVKYLKGDGTWSTLGNASSADTITTNPVLEAANNKISVTVGGKKSNELTVPFATTSDKIYTSNVSDNLNHYITFVSDNSDDYKDLKQNINLTYNPYDGVLNSLGINVTNLNSTDITATNIYIGNNKLEEIFAPIIHYHDYLPLTGGTLTGNLTIEKSSTGDCMYWTQVTDTGFTPKVGFGTGASKNRGVYDSVKGWVLKIDTNDIVTFEGKAQEAFYADSAGEVPWTGITGKPDCYNPCAHQHLTDDIINLTGYTAITELPALTPNLITSDTLNQALAKLEYKANNGQAAYIWYRSVTGEDDDAIINKWEEIKDFIESVAEGTDITEEFVTTKTAQNVEGVKLFLGTMYFGNTVEFFHPVTFHSDIILSETSAVIGNIQLGHTDDAIDYVIKPSTDQCSMIGLPDRQFYQMYALEFCEDGTPLASKYAPISHASSAATYGIGTTSNYGHVKISNGDVDTVSHSNGLVAGMDHTHSSIMGSMSITLPATAGWYRIATSNSGIQRCSGLFSIESTVANRHTTCILNAHTSYGITDATGITVLSCSHWTYAGISKARIVYHTTYSGKYAYLEIYQPYASAGVVTVKLFGNYGWTLLDSVTAGSIPSGYSNKEVTLSNNTIVA